jgi:molybdate transport system permease protein
VSPRRDPPARAPLRLRGASIPFVALLVTALALTLAFLVLPVVALVTEVPPRRLVAGLGDQVARDALRLSLLTTVAAVAIIVAVGTPAAYWLATRAFRGKNVVETLLELPLVLPPAVAGIALLAALGPKGLLGGVLADAHIALVFQTAGVIVALTFVAAPLYLRQAQSAFSAVDESWLEAARTLGSSEAGAFIRIAVPAARSGLLSGITLAWARALGEFGATLLFAGALQGVTQTAPIAIYQQFATDLPAALALAVVLLVVSAALLLVVKLVAGSDPLVPSARRPS